MNVLTSLENVSLDELLGALKPFQRKHIEKLVLSADPQKALDIWLESGMPADTVGFGLNQERKGFGAEFKKEFRKLICGDSSYDSLRSEIKQELPRQGAQTAIVSMISIEISKHIGAIPDMVVPAVVLGINIITKVGVQAWCNSSSIEAGPPTSHH